MREAEGVQMCVEDYKIAAKAQQLIFPNFRSELACCISDSCKELCRLQALFCTEEPAEGILHETLIDLGGMMTYSIINLAI